MPRIALTGADVVTLNDRIFNDFADGDINNLEFPNEIASVKTGKNGNSIYAANESGRQADLMLRVIRGSDDDKYLNGLIAQQRLNFADFVLMRGEFIKKIGDGAGNVTNDTYVCSGGVFTKIPGAKSNTDGDTEQSVVEYAIKFSNAPRTLT